MKIKSTLLLTAILTLVFLQCGRGSVTVLKSEKQKIGYAFGTIQGTQLNKSIPNFEKVLGSKSFADGVYDMLVKGKCKFDEKKMRELTGIFRTKMTELKKKKGTLSFKDKEAVSYAFACSNSRRLRPMLEGVLDEASLGQGLEDSIKGKNLMMKPAEVQAMMKKFSTAIAKNRAKKSAPKKATSAQEKKNLKDGQDYLAKKAKEAGIKSMPTGVLYKVLKSGHGKKPTLSDSVTVHYRGTLTNGKEFDSSYKRKQPATFGVTQVIKGWTDILQLMPVGSKWQVFIPQQFAYGSNAKPTIPAFSALIFDIELIKINPPRKMPTKK